MVKDNKTKKTFFKIAVLYSIVMVILYLPSRWNSDVEGLKFALTYGEGYVFVDDKEDEIPTSAYTVVEGFESFEPYSFALVLDKKHAYFGAVELRPEWKLMIKAANLRKEKEKFYRVHMLKMGEYENLKLDKNSLYLRLRRAVLERSVDLIVLKNAPKRPLEYSRTKLEKFFKGFIVERPRPHPEPQIPRFLIFISFILFLFSLSGVFSIFSLILYMISPNVAVSIASVFSTIAIYRRTRKHTAASFLMFLLLGIVTSLSLSDFQHLNQLEVYRFVKLSLLLLPLLVLLKGVYENRWIFYDKRSLYIFTGFAALITVYYISRSGNYSIVPDFERSIRDFLDEIFIVRPRFKDMFGYFFLPLSRKKSKYSFLYEFFGVIGLVSTFNTFCHIKAPIFVSLYRSFLGFAIGIAVYYIFVGFLKIAKSS